MNKSVFAVVGLTSLLFIAGCSPESVEVEAPAAVEISASQVVSETIVEWDEYTGKIESPETVDLTPRVSGYVDRVMFNEGAVVEQGDVLFKIDDALHRAEVKRLQAELQDANSALDLSEANFARAERLVAAKVLPEKDFDQIVSNLQRAKAHVASVEAGLERAEIDLSYTEVRAPISGRVSNAEITAGNYVRAGESLLTQIVSISEVYAYFQADEAAYLKYVHMAANGSRPSSRDASNPVLMSLADNRGFVFRGEMDFVDNRIDPTSGTMTGRAVFNNSDGLLIPGLFARLRLLGSGAHEAILIEDRAILTDLGKRYVLVVNNENVVEYREIVPGSKVQGLRVIESGLEAGDMVVVRGLQRVAPGSQVQVNQVPMTSAETIAAIRAEVQSSTGPGQIVAKI